MKKYVGPFLLMIFLVLLTFLRSDYQHLGLMLLLSIQALLSLGFWLFYGVRKNIPNQYLCLSLAGGAVVSLLVCIFYEDVHMADGVAAAVASAVLCLSYGIMDVYLRQQSAVPTAAVFQGQREHKDEPGKMLPQFTYLFENKKYTGIPRDLGTFRREDYELKQEYTVYVNTYAPHEFFLQERKLQKKDFLFFGFGLILILLITWLYLS